MDHVMLDADQAKSNDEHQMATSHSAQAMVSNGLNEKGSGKEAQTAVQLKEGYDKNVK
jgi:hypothetical protein